MSANEDTKEEKDFYKARGMIRQMVVLTPEGRDKLKKIASTNSMTVGEAIEALVENYDSDAIQHYFAELRKAKFIKNRIKNLSPEQLAKIEAIIG